MNRVIRVTSGGGGGGSPVSLDDLSDVSVSSPAQGHMIYYDAAVSRWKNALFLDLITPGVKSYTPSDNGGGYYGGYDLTYIDDGDFVTNGTIWLTSGVTPIEMTMTFASAVRLTRLRLLAGQFNGNFNAPTAIDVYRGTSAGTLLANITPTYSDTEYDFSNSNINTVYTLVITPSGSGHMSIREIQAYGFDF